MADYCSVDSGGDLMSDELNARRWEYEGMALQPSNKSEIECIKVGCVSPKHKRGLCKEHFSEARAAIIKHRYAEPALRFSLSSIRSESGCLLWVGSIGKDGYGLFKSGGRTYRAHRYALGIRDNAGLYVMHKCDEPRCVDPEHLFIGTQEDNMRDMRMKKRSPDLNGGNNPAAILTREEIGEIRRLYVYRERTLSMLADQYKVSISAIHKAITGRTWRNV